MNCHLFYLHLRRVGLDSRQANILVNGAKRHDLGDYENAMLELAKNGASVPTIIELCQWAKRNQIKPSWVTKRAVLFSQYRNLGESAVTMYIHELVIR